MIEWEILVLNNATNLDFKEKQIILFLNYWNKYYILIDSINNSINVLSVNILFCNFIKNIYNNSNKLLL